MSTTILDELGWRGLIAQSTDIDALPPVPPTSDAEIVGVPTRGDAQFGGRYPDDRD